MSEIEKLYLELSSGYVLKEKNVLLQLEACRISIRSNSDELLKKLAFYFAHTLAEDTDNNLSDIEIVAINAKAPDLNLNFIDWKREPGKTGRKDAYVDLIDGRVIKKIRTGMIFIQSKEYLLAIGPCLENDNQVINYINAQYMNVLQHNGALICHASALAKNNECFAIAAFSGGGKSTLMLNLLEEAELKYVTNDRLLLNDIGDGINAYGIPKLPRVNPGTIINNDRLRPMLTDQKQEELSSLSKDSLWELEEKYDVLLHDLYGAEKIIPKAKLKAFLVLNWERDSVEACKLEKINLSERKDLLPAIMKSPGPFYQYEDNHFFSDDIKLDEQPYFEILKDTDIFEATGNIDFSFASRFFLNHIAI